MVVKVINREESSEWSEILRTMKVYADSNGLESVFVKKEVPETKGIIIEQIVFNLLIGMTANVIYDLLKTVIKSYKKEKQDVINNIKIEIEDGDNKESIEINTILNKED